MTAVDTDFPNYYTASRLLLDGKDISRIYDDRWFQEQISSFGIDQQGIFTPFPPITAFLMVPLAMLSPQTALRVWTIINIALVVCTIIVTTKISKKNWKWCTLIILSSGIALINNFRFGQMYLLLTLLILLGYYLLQKEKIIGSGILLGIGAAFKYFPFAFLPLFIIRKQWTIVLSFIATVVFIYYVGLAFLGIDVYSRFFSTVILNHTEGNLHNPFSATYQSWSSLLHRICIYDSELNPTPLFNSFTLYNLLKYLIVTSVIGVLVWLMIRTRYVSNELKLSIQLSLFTITGLLLLPASATYHFLILILPIALLLSNSPWNIWQKVLLGSYAMIGFMPYRFFRTYEGQGWHTLLAYPRLWLITVMFFAVCCYIIMLTHKKFNSVSLAL